MLSKFVQTPRSWKIPQDNTNTARSTAFNHWPHVKDTKKRNYFTFNKRFFWRENKTFGSINSPRVTLLSVKDRGEKNKTFFGLMVSAHHCWTLGSLLLNLYFASSLPDLWIAAHFFFSLSNSKRFFRCCTPRLTPDNSSRKVITVKHSQAAPFYSN